MRLEELERELQAERPEIESDFATKLDEWAAAGFPRGGELDPRAPRNRFGSGIPVAFRNAWERITAVPPRRLLAPVGALATLVVIGGVAISQVGDDGSDGIGGPQVVTETAVPPGETETGAAADVDSADEQALSEGSQGTAPAPDALSGAIPAVPESADRAIRESARSSDATTELDYAVGAPGGPSNASGGGIARGSETRHTDATARLSLGAEADEVQEVANGVVEVTDRYKGVVLNSQVTSDQGGARASFELEIPFTQLDAALTDLSELGDVISRTEAGEDITAKAVRAQKQLADSFDEIRKLRLELIGADSREEKLILRSQISSMQAQADSFEAELNGVKREARFASVQVDVTSNGPDTDDGDWGLDDALDDAGDVLTTLGGIALVSLAILVPLGLVAAIAFWIAMRAQRSRRERTLGE